LTAFSSLAERTNTHIMFIHHQTKPNEKYGRKSGSTVLGSQAIFGSVDACLIFEQVGDSTRRTLAVKGRAIDDFDECQLIFDKTTQTYKIERVQDDF
jgi:hypothetical protein